MEKDELYAKLYELINKCKDTLDHIKAVMRVIETLGVKHE